MNFRHLLGCDTIVNMQNLKLLVVLLLETSQKSPFQKETSYRNSIFTPWNRAKLEKKITFMPENIFSGTKLYRSLHFYGFQSKTKKIICSIFRDVYIALRLEKSFKKFYGRCQDLIEKYQRSVNVMVNDLFPG